MDLTFNQLRLANVLRLPLFVNKHGGHAHSKQDGSDWNPAQWLQALVGELGEWAEVRLQYETGQISREEYAQKSAKELADVQTYLDILARRSLDVVDPHAGGSIMDAPFMLMAAVSYMGSYANSRKKFERGDMTREELGQVAMEPLTTAMQAIGHLYLSQRFGADVPTRKVIQAHPRGVDLGEATADKFNEVSGRIGVDVQIKPEGVEIGIGVARYRHIAPFHFTPFL